MSRCKACNKILSYKELKRKSWTTKEYIDLCNNCFESISGQVITEPVGEEDNEDYEDFIQDEFLEGLENETRNS